MISGAGLCWQHVGGVGSTTTTTGMLNSIRRRLRGKYDGWFEQGHMLSRSK